MVPFAAGEAPPLWVFETGPYTSELAQPSGRIYKLVYAARCYNKRKLPPGEMFSSWRQVFSAS